MHCKRCSAEFTPVRVVQVYCGRKCRVADAVSRHRSDYTKPTLTIGAEKRLQALSDAPTASEPRSMPVPEWWIPAREVLSEVELKAMKAHAAYVVRGKAFVPLTMEEWAGLNPAAVEGPTPGALQGDDYPLTYDENGFPELPPCLDRRKVKINARAA